MLVACGWVVQNFLALNLGIGQGIALREVPLKSGRCETFFRDERDPHPRSRPVFAFHRPETSPSR